MLSYVNQSTNQSNMSSIISVKQIRTGKDFNEYFNGVRFVFSTINGLIHHDTIFKEGLNIDSKSFNRDRDSREKRFKITPYDKMWYMIASQDNTSMTNLADTMYEVTIPDDAKVVAYLDECRVDKMILSEPKSLWKDPELLKHIAATSLSGLQYIDKYAQQTPELCSIAVKNNATSLTQVINPTYDLYLESVIAHGTTIWKVPESFQTEQLCMEAIKRDPRAIQGIKNTSIRKKCHEYMTGYNNIVSKMQAMTIN